MTNQDKSETEAVGQVGVVHVNRMAGDSLTLDFVPDQTIKQYLEQANVSAGAGEVVTVNGVKVTDEDMVPDVNSVIVVVGAVKNG